MNLKSLRVWLAIIIINISFPVLSQDFIISDNAIPGSVIDSLRRNGIIFNEKRTVPDVTLSTRQSIDFLRKKFQAQYWKNLSDPLRTAIGQLVFEASHPPYDSAEYFIRQYPFDSLDVSWDKFYIWEPLRIKIPVIFHPESPIPVDTLVLADTNKIGFASDSSARYDLILPDPLSRSKPVTTLKDTTIYVVVDTIDKVSSDRRDFPFTYYDQPFQADSIRAAVKTLTDYLQLRDSSIVYITGISDVTVPVWLNSRTDMMHRYWLKNDFNDSVTVWIGPASKNTLGLYLEDGVNFRRPVKQGDYSEARIDIREIDRSKLLEVQKIITKPLLWKYRSEASFALNQGAVSNWVKGGDNNVSLLLDITGYADYNNKLLKITSSNFARLKYGLVASGENGIRKNLDLLETNSKLNHKAFGKFDFSGILLFKTQIARGYNYPNDSVPVSKFLNPAILTTGIGLDYKPNKTTSINFSPFSYKGTYVPDTAVIDQTKYGITADRRSKHEPGASFMISHEYKPVKKVTVLNRLQLFTNYINNPVNIDIDWEMILTANLNWFTDVRFNTHLIFDDDTKTTVLGDDKKPVLGPDGKPKKAARIQFKELLGFSFIFRF